MGESPPIEDIDELEKTPEGQVERWIGELLVADKDVENWEKKSERIIEWYRNEQGYDYVIEQYGEKVNKFNLFWSNIQTLQPLVYPKGYDAYVERRFKDREPVARLASQILERSLSYCIDSYPFDENIRYAVDDYLLISRGQAWLRYVPTIAAPGGMEEVVYEEVLCEYIDWRCFRHSPCRVWSENRWVAKELYLTRAQLVEAFGADIGNDVNLDYASDQVKRTHGDRLRPDQEYLKRARVYEIWDKDTRQVYWISKNYSKSPLKVEKDPLRLREFFPCPKPLYGTLTSNKLIPTPDFVQYEDQLRNLNNLVERRALLLRAIKVAGCYDASIEELSRVLDEAMDNQWIGVENWMAFSQQGGFKGATDFVDVSPYIKAYQIVNDCIEREKASAYEITGIADIIRGYSSPSATATAENIKGQFASLRIQDRKDKVTNFVKDILRIKGEIISEHFSEQTLWLTADVEQLGPEAMQMFPQAVQLLRSDALRSFRIQIESSDSVVVNEQEEKQQRVEYLQTVGGFLDKVLQAASSFPTLLPLLSEMLLFVSRSFKAGRNLESSVEQSMMMIQQQIQQQQQAAAQQPPPPEPAVIKAQMDNQFKQQQLQFTTQLEQFKAMFESQKMKLEESRRDKELASQFALQSSQLKLEAEKIRGDLALRAAELQKSDEQKQADLMQRQMEMHQKGETEAAKTQASASPQNMNISMRVPTPVKKEVTFTKDENGNMHAVVIETPIEQ